MNYCINCILNCIHIISGCINSRVVYAKKRHINRLKNSIFSYFLNIPEIKRISTQLWRSLSLELKYGNLWMTCMFSKSPSTIFFFPFYLHEKFWVKCIYFYFSENFLVLETVFKKKQKVIWFYAFDKVTLKYNLITWWLL